MKIVKGIINKILDKIVGKIRFQKFFEILFNVSVRGMNFGNGGNFKESGELFVLNHIKTELINQNQLIIFDVGANNGNYSKAVSEIFKKETIIHSFEPSKFTFQLFLETTKDISNVIPNNLGLSNIESIQLLYTDIDGSVLASLHKRNLEHCGIIMDNSEDVKLTTIDIYCKEKSIDRIHFLKLDIEGNEYKALLGAKNMIELKKIDYIQFEFGGANIDSRTYFQDLFYLLNDKYFIYRVLIDGIVEIALYSERFEIYNTINYLAVKK